MRVALVTSLRSGGPLDHSITLAGAFVASGHDVRVVCRDDAVAGRFRARGADAVVAPLRRPFDLPGAARLHRALRGCEVVHAQDRRSGLWTRLPPFAVRGVPRIYTFHGLPDAYLPPEAGLPGRSARDRLAYERLDPALARRSAAVVVPSRYMASAVTSRLGFPADKLVVIPNGVEPGARCDGELVGTVSVLEPVKGLDVFVRAAAALAGEGPEAEFVCFGEGGSRAELTRLASSLGLDGRIGFPGHAPPGEALARLRVFVLPSWMESAPLALLQAMASGVPAVATRVGGVPEIAADVAELVPPGDPDALAAAVRRLLSDPEHAAALAEAARQRVESRFTADRCAREHLALYERVLSGGAPQ